ncbi:MAG: Fe-S cluster assembly protein SufD [Bacteroidota bacterium]|nr:Fe-S cluster assembly protein SufD [Bacteroidota bacterium]
METITQKNTIKDKLISEFEASKTSLFGNPELRDLAIENFSKMGVPSRKQEEYRYLNMDMLLKAEFAVGTDKTIHDAAIEKLSFLKNAILVVICNGKFSETASRINDLPKGLTICGLSEASKKYFSVFDSHFCAYADSTSDSFIAMNTALSGDGVFVHVEKSAVIEKPVHIIHVGSVSENSILNFRNLIVAEENAQLTVVESYSVVETTSKLFNNTLTEIIVSENANVDHYKVQDEGDAGHSVNTTQVIQKKSSVFSTHTFTLSGALVRNNLNIVLDAEHIESHLNGLYLTKGTQVIDNHTLVDHRKPNCNSNELYKGIIEDKSSATFNGKIYVRKDAQKTNAFQSNKNILLSDDGTINTKPQLEIYADDVKCSHGTSTGKLDEEKIFYLRARGLSEITAKKMLMHAFASEVVDTVKIEELREYVEAQITNRFE